MIPAWLAGLSIFSVVGAIASVVLLRGIWRSGADWLDDFRVRRRHRSDPNDGRNL